MSDNQSHATDASPTNAVDRNDGHSEYQCGKLHGVLEAFKAIWPRISSLYAYIKRSAEKRAAIAQKRSSDPKMIQNLILLRDEEKLGFSKIARRLFLMNKKWGRRGTDGTMKPRSSTTIKVLYYKWKARMLPDPRFLVRHREWLNAFSNLYELIRDTDNPEEMEKAARTVGPALAQHLDGLYNDPDNPDEAGRAKWRAFVARLDRRVAMQGNDASLPSF
jgi:hypothetical protein